MSKNNLTAAIDLAGTLLYIYPFGKVMLESCLFWTSLIKSPVVWLSEEMGFVLHVRQAILLPSSLKCRVIFLMTLLRGNREITCIIGN